MVTAGLLFDYGFKISRSSLRLCFTGNFLLDLHSVKNIYCTVAVYIGGEQLLGCELCFICSELLDLDSVHNVRNAVAVNVAGSNRLGLGLGLA